MATGEISPKRWTSEEFSQLGELGLLGSERAELIEGDIFMRSPQEPNHAMVVSLLSQVLQAAIGTGFHVRVRMPLQLEQHSVPEPDLAVVSGVPRDYLSDHPTTAVLVIEVSDSTLNHDRDTKGGLYARSGIPEYWLVNLPAGVVEIHRQPTSETYMDIPEMCAEDIL
jgi:Uma2 family endonuclease